MGERTVTGGCQCGAVRYAIDGELGRASICHCRMCQKAFGAFYGPLVGAPGLRWTRGGPKRFRSSSGVRRGFCGDCGTPLTFEPDRGSIDVAIGTLDDPAAAEPVVQLALGDGPPWVANLGELPGPEPEEQERDAVASAAMVSFQHPDHDTIAWSASDRP